MGANKKIKIAFLMQESKMGGIEYNSVHLAGAMDQSKFEVIFLCPGEGKLPSELTAKNMPFLLYQRPHFFSTSTKIFDRYIFNPFATLFNFLTFPFLAFSVSALLRKEKFDLVIAKGLVANFYGALAAGLAGIPCLWDMQEVVSKEKFFGLMSFVLNLWAFLFVKGIVLSSRAIQAQFWKSIQPKTFWIPNGIDVEKYGPAVNPQKVRAEWGVKPEEVLIGHIARFTYWKGQKDFVMAAARVTKEVPKAKFVLVGDSVFEGQAYEKEVKALAQNSDLEGRVLFPGFRDDLADVMAAIDIFVHSSIEAEGCPITLITAMSMAKSVVATNVEGNDEIISNSNQALLVPPSDPGAIAQAMLRFIKDSEFAKAVAANARQRILERYSLRVYAGGCEEVFEKIAA